MKITHFGNLGQIEAYTIQMNTAHRQGNKGKDNKIQKEIECLIIPFKGDHHLLLTRLDLLSLSERRSWRNDINIVNRSQTSILLVVTIQSVNNIDQNNFISDNLKKILKIIFELNFL